MPTAVREAAIAAVHARLVATLPGLLPGVVIERVRRAPVDIRSESLPRVMLAGAGMEIDTRQDPTTTHYTIEFEVAGYVTASTDAGLELAQADMHAAVVSALVPWQPATDGLGEVAEQAVEFAIVDSAESSRRAAEILCRFTILAITPTGSPYL